jgi:predicted alpha/beta hydrolase family esterase
MPIQRVFIIHGTNGNSKENWFPWLKEELNKASPDIRVIVPDLPTGNNQSLENWLKAFQPFIKYVTVIAYLSAIAWAPHSYSHCWKGLIQKSVQRSW